jgi:hypothetical protein
MVNAQVPDRRSVASIILALILNVLTAAVLTVVIAISWSNYRNERLAERKDEFFAVHHDFATRQLQFAALLVPTLIAVVCAGCWLSTRSLAPERRWALMSAAAMLATVGGVIVDIDWIIGQMTFVF